jgi:hypothetical protein
MLFAPVIEEYTANQRNRFYIASLPCLKIVVFKKGGFKILKTALEVTGGKQPLNNLQLDNRYMQLPIRINRHYLLPYFLYFQKSNMDFRLLGLGEYCTNFSVLRMPSFLVDKTTLIGV